MPEFEHWCPKIIPQVPSQCQEFFGTFFKKFNKNPETREKIFIKFSLFSFKNLLQFKPRCDIIIS